MKLLGTFCYNPQKVFPVYFVLRVTKTPSSSGYWKKQRPMTGVEAEWTPDNGRYKLYTEYGRELAGDDVGYWFTFDDLRTGEQVEVRMGISYVSTENARRNLDARTARRNIVRRDPRGGPHAVERRPFAHPRRGRHGGAADRVLYGAVPCADPPEPPERCQRGIPADGAFGRGGGYRRRTLHGLFAVGDTYRNVHQLLTLVYPERQLDMVRSMIGMYEEWGWMPKWELYGPRDLHDGRRPGHSGHRRHVDEGAARLRRRDGLRGVSASRPRRPGRRTGCGRTSTPMSSGATSRWVSTPRTSRAIPPCRTRWSTTSPTHALSLLADSLGHGDDARLFRDRSLGYRHYYDREFGTLRPINDDGTFLEPFDPKAGENFTAAPGFHEGSAWNYTFFVPPTDVEGLAKLMGGRRKFVDKLQMVFDEGLYDPANEPDIAYAYLFSRFPGEEWRTQREVRRLLDTCFTTAADGIPGNDDTGTMSAWAVFSMMGFYPDCPGEPYYTLTAPVFDRVEIATERGPLVIEAERPADGAGYIGRMTLGGRPLGKYRLSHDELLGGGRLKFELKNDK